MAKQATAAEQTAPQGTDQLQDILILHDQLGKMLHAVTGADESGNPQMAPLDEGDNNTFLKVDKFSSILENFWKNFVSQFKDPTNFNLISMKEGDLNDPKIKKALKDLAAGKETKAVKDFLEKYEIRAKTPQEVAQSNIDWAALEKAGLSRAALEKAGMVNVLSKIVAGETVKVEETRPQAYRYSESLIDWETLAAVGISKEMLIQRGLLDQMLKGYKTNELVPLTYDDGTVRIRLEARLSLMPGENGVKLYMNSVRQKPDLDRAFMGHIFSETDKNNLQETGNLGRVVPLQWRDGSVSDSFISIDRLTNDIVALKSEYVRIPEMLAGVKFTPDEINALKEGQKIHIDGFESSKNPGHTYPADIQYNADRRGVQFFFENEKLFNAQAIAGVAITDKMRELVNEGKAILLENMVSKTGESYDRYIKLDPATGRPNYTKYNPDSPEDARQIVLPREIGGVQLKADERQELGEGKPVWIQGIEFRNSTEPVDRWVKCDLNTGDLRFATAPDKFEERAAIKVPQEIKGAQLSSVQRAQLQDGKAVLVDGIIGYDKKPISQWVRMNPVTGKSEMFNENPDRTRNPEQRNAINRNPQRDENKRGQGIK